MRIELLNCVVGIIKEGASLVASAVPVPDAWYHNAPTMVKPVRDANPHGVSWPDYIGHQMTCTNKPWDWLDEVCGGIMLDDGVAHEDSSQYRCTKCGHVVTVQNTKYHSDHPDAKFGYRTPQEIELTYEIELEEVMKEIANFEWIPKIPISRKELWDLQRRLSYFSRVAKATNDKLKSLDRLIDAVKAIKKDRKLTKDEDKRLSALFGLKKGRRWISGRYIFDVYCRLLAMYPMEEYPGGWREIRHIAHWVLSNWDALTIAKGWDKPSNEIRFKMEKNEEGDLVEVEFDAEFGVTQQGTSPYRFYSRRWKKEDSKVYEQEMLETVTLLYKEYLDLGRIAPEAISKCRSVIDKARARDWVKADAYEWLDELESE